MEYKIEISRGTTYERTLHVLLKTFSFNYNTTKISTVPLTLIKQNNLHTNLDLLLSGNK